MFRRPGCVVRIVARPRRATFDAARRGLSSLESTRAIPFFSFVLAMIALAASSQSTVAAPRWLPFPSWQNQPTAPPELPPIASQPHPAVARIIVPESDATSFGSGTLVDANSRYGIVVTNWHVVRDAQGVVMVVFPGGFQSTARVLSGDPTWDLAALLVHRPPNVAPVRLAQVAPQQGDMLTIAGYGSGWYRAASGPVVQYVSPATRQPAEMIEANVAARNGDSGGPMLNASGELAGVLFGEGGGRTTGSYVGRVQGFLATVHLPQTDAALEESIASDRNNVAQSAPPTYSESPTAEDSPIVRLPPITLPQFAPPSIEPPAAPNSDPIWRSENAIVARQPAEPAPPIAAISPNANQSPGNHERTVDLSPPQPADSPEIGDRMEQTKTFLFVFACMAGAMMLLRMLSPR
jgi:hypothetical protein